MNGIPLLIVVLSLFQGAFAGKTFVALTQAEKTMIENGVNKYRSALALGKWEESDKSHGTQYYKPDELEWNGTQPIAYMKMIKYSDELGELAMGGVESSDKGTKIDNDKISLAMKAAPNNTKNELELALKFLEEFPPSQKTWAMDQDLSEVGCIKNQIPETVDHVDYYEYVCIFKGKRNDNPQFDNGDMCTKCAKGCVKATGLCRGEKTAEGVVLKEINEEWEEKSKTMSKSGESGAITWILLSFVATIMLF